MPLIDDINNYQILLVVMNKSDYLSKSPEVVKSIAETSSKICYVALNKPYNSVILNLQNNGVDASKFFFIDVLTSSVQTPVPVDNAEFVQGPSALTDISLAFSLAMNEKGCDNALFDAISTLAIYSDISSLIKFTQNLMTKVRVNNKKAVFIGLKEDSEELIKDLTMFVDKVVNL